MRKLTETERSLLRLRFVLGYSYREIAMEYLGEKMPEAHIRVYVNRSKRRLREFYEDALQTQ
jgi:DNA-directed RNA polymerase specialized sigma24 family protein